MSERAARSPARTRAKHNTPAQNSAEARVASDLPDKVEVHIGYSVSQVAHAFAVLILLALGYLVALMWVDYLITIVSACILAQALYMPRTALERYLAQSAAPAAPLTKKDGASQLELIVRGAKQLAIDLWDLPLVTLAMLLIGQLFRRFYRPVLVLLGASGLLLLLATAMRLALSRLAWLGDAARARFDALRASATQRIEAIPVPPPLVRVYKLCTSEAAARRLHGHPDDEASTSGAMEQEEEDLHEDLRPPPSAASPHVVRAARLLLGATVILCVLNGALLTVYGVRDAIDVVRDSAGATSCALDASGAIDATESLARQAQQKLPDALAWAGAKLGSERRAAVCWPLVELVLLGSANESVPALVDATVAQLRTCYPDAERLLDLVAPPQPPPTAASADAEGGAGAAGGGSCGTSASERGALRLLLEYIVSEPDDDDDAAVTGAGAAGDLDVVQVLMDAGGELAAAVTATLREHNLMESAQKKAMQLASSAAQLAQSEQASAFAQSSLALIGGTVHYASTLLGFVLRSIQSALHILVFASFTLSFLALPHDPLRTANDTMDSLLQVSLPEPKLQSIRHAFWAASVLPVTVAARHANLGICLFWLCGVPYKYLAACILVGFSLFPITSAALVVSSLWTGVGLLHAATCTGVTVHVLRQLAGLLALPLVLAHCRSETETMLVANLGVSAKLFSFCVFLGVSTFGKPGLLFGPVLVCGGKKLLEVLSTPNGKKA